jgi:hypothetical protein
LQPTLNNQVLRQEGTTAGQGRVSTGVAGEVLEDETAAVEELSRTVLDLTLGVLTAGVLTTGVLTAGVLTGELVL